MRILEYGDAGLLIEVDDLDTVMALHAALAEHPLPGVEDVVPAARTILLRLTPGTDRTRIRQAVRDLPLRPAAAHPVGEVEIPVCYNGADLADIAATTGLSETEVVAAHTAATWIVAFCGFAPGFGYLVGDDPRLRVPRRAESRTRVPAGSVALADGFTGVYPRSSPGGWQLLGRTDVAVWNLDRDPPGLLRPGTRVKFVPV